MSSTRPDPENERAIVMMVLVIGAPIVALIAIGSVVQALGPALPWVIGLALVFAALFGFYKFRTSAPSIRGDHEREVLDLLSRAETQQRQLPAQFPADVLKRAFERKDVNYAAIAGPIETAAQSIYAEEFLRSLPGVPGVPLQPERIYDVDYDRRTLKKGEEPPYRERTDSKGRPTTLELEDYKNWLHRFVASTVKPEATLQHFAKTLAECLSPILMAAGPMDGAGQGLTVPLVDLVPNGKALFSAAIASLYARNVREWHHFSSVRRQFESNRERLSASTLRVRDLAIGSVLNPADFDGSLRDAVDAFLAGSPLRAMFFVGVPFSIPAAKRFEGHHIVARQGSGKTNALECLIASDLEEVAAGRASLVVMDSQGLAPDTLIGRLATLKAFSPGGPLEDKLIYLEPDLEYPLALNIFDIGLKDMGQLSLAQREDVISSACEVVEFLFTGLLGGELSDNMTMLYRYLVPAMIAIPDADMNTFIDLLDADGGKDKVPEGFAKYQRHFVKLEPEIRSFLEHDYLKDAELIKTKAAVRRRLRASLANTTFRRMFTQPRNKLNLFRELQSAKVIVVNTYPAKNYVEQFGRLFLALLMQATRQRLEIDRDQRMPTFVYIDECQDYIAREERIARYIDKCRKQNVGLVLAHQRLGNIENAKVLSALQGVPIKFSGSSDADPSELATMVMSTPEHIRALPRGRFAAFVSGVTPQAVDINFPLSPLEHAPRLTSAQFETRRADMRRRFATHYQEARPTEPDITDAEFTEPAPQVAIEDKRERSSREPEDYDPLA